MTKTITHSAAIKKFLLIVVSGMLLSACVGRQEALNVAGNLKTGSMAVAETTTKLSERDEKLVEAFNGLRERTADILQENQKTQYETRNSERKSDARAEAAALYAGLLENLNDSFKGKQNDENLTRVQTVVNVVEAGMEEPRKKLNEMKTKLAELRTRLQAQGGADRSLKDEIDKRTPRYFAALTAYEVQFFDLTAEALEKLELERSQIASEIKTKYTDMLQTIEKYEAPELSEDQLISASDFGPEVTSQTDVYKKLIDYEEEVASSADKITYYLQSNSLGSGSFLARAVERLVAGVIQGLGGKEPPTKEELKEMGKNAVQPFKEAAKDSLDEAQETFKTESEKLIKDGLNKLGSTVSTFIEGKIPKIMEAIFGKEEATA